MLWQWERTASLVCQTRSPREKQRAKETVKFLTRETAVYCMVCLYGVSQFCHVYVHLHSCITTMCDKELKIQSTMLLLALLQEH